MRLFHSTPSRDAMNPSIPVLYVPSHVVLQRGAILATELKNNSAKLAKWTAQSILGGADVMKIG